MKKELYQKLMLKKAYKPTWLDKKMLQLQKADLQRQKWYNKNSPISQYNKEQRNKRLLVSSLLGGYTGYTIADLLDASPSLKLVAVLSGAGLGAGASLAINSYNKV